MANAAKPPATMLPAAWRLVRQRLAGNPARDPETVARDLVGVQAQVLSSAALSIALRSKGSTEQTTRALAERRLIRSWGMRGTLHLFDGDDFPTIVAALKVKEPWRRPAWLRYFGMTERQMEAGIEAVGEILDDGVPRTRAQLAGDMDARFGRAVGELVRGSWGSFLKQAANKGYASQAWTDDSSIAFVRPDRWLSLNPIPITAGVRKFWATAPNDVWAWGESEVMRWDGRGWSRVDAPVRQIVTAMWGAPNDVWLRASRYAPRYLAGCQRGGGYLDTTLHHWDGREWTSTESQRLFDHPSLPFRSSVQQLSPAPDPTKVVGRDELARLWWWHGDGNAMPDFNEGYRSGGGEIWAATADGRRIAHFDGDRWVVRSPLASGNFSAVRMISASEGWAVSRRPRGNGDGADPHLGGPAGDGLFRWDGRAWRFFRELPERVNALWASAADDVWAVGEQSLVMHWDGARWSEQRLPGNFRAIWGRGRDDVWINGCGDFFYHWDGATWRHVPSSVPPSHMGVCAALWGASATDVSAIGYDASLRWDGAAWKKQLDPTEPVAGSWRYDKLRAGIGYVDNARIFALWGAHSGGDLWAVGQEDIRAGFDGWPLVLRRRDGRWSKLPTPQTEGTLLAAWGDRDDRVWAVGTKGIILRWDGASWTQEESGVIEQLSSIHGAGGTVWIVGDRGTVLVRSLGST